MTNPEIIIITSEGSYLPLISKDCVINTHGKAVYVKVGLLFAWESSPENSWWFLFTFSMGLTSFRLSISDAVSLNTDNSLSFTLSANVFGD